MNFQLSPDALLTAIESDVRAGLIPLYVCLTLGTTSTTAVDPLLALSEIAKRFLMWVHVDAAYAGSACICPEFRHFLDGVKDQTDLTKALSNDPELLKNKASDTKNVVDYKDWQIALSRRFRSMKLWMVIRSYGVIGLQERFEVVVPRKFATVCFKVLAPNASNEDSKRLTQTLLDSLNASGLVYMTHVVIEGVYVIRVAIGATLTEEKHVRMLWDTVQEHATHLLASYADIQ
ncbi:putative carboxy-lyase [Helianthus annuus]|nr:putative carboxy-lyase [Helianthus annuus]